MTKLHRKQCNAFIISLTVMQMLCPLKQSATHRNISQINYGSQIAHQNWSQYAKNQLMLECSAFEAHSDSFKALNRGEESELDAHNPLLRYSSYVSLQLI